jgi:hypothetical protein
MGLALIEKKRTKIEKINVPKEYIEIVEKAIFKIPFKVIYANYPMNNHLSEDGHEIVKILGFKTLLNDFLKANLEFLSEVRIIVYKL